MYTFAFLVFCQFIEFRLIISESLVFIQSGHLLHFFIGQEEVEDLKVFLNMGFIAGSRDSDVACLEMPAQDDLSGRFSMCSGDGTDRAVVEEFLCVAAAAEREPGFQYGTILINMALHFLALVVRMRFILKDRRFDRSGIHQTVEICRFIEVGKPDRAQLAGSDCPFHSLICLNII